MDRILLLICAVAPVIRSKYDYFAASQTGTWEEGKEQCILEGGYYASIHSLANYNEVIGVCEDTDELTECCYIGMFDAGAGTGEWEWNDKSKLDYGFAGGKPNGQSPPWSDNANSFTDDTSNNEHCQFVELETHRNEPGYYDDTSCGLAYYPICSRCSEVGVGDVCETNSDCNEPCQRCCIEWKVCETKPGYPGYLGDSHSAHTQGFSEMGFNDAKVINNVKDTSYSYYGYIILVGVIAFILVNNIFIGCWCLKKGGEQYKKVDMIANEI